jgi:iron-sulfur cluster repair protein YtfE (RIC family)
MWLESAKSKQAEINELKAKLAALENLQVDCMIDQVWFMKGTPVANLIQHASEVYKAEAVAQNSKIEFGTDDNEHWFALMFHFLIGFK